MTAEEILKKTFKDSFLDLDYLELYLEAMESYAYLKVAEATKGMYPKEFVKWLVTGEGSDIDKLFEHWKQNIRE